MLRMEEKWLYVVQVFVCILFDVQGDEEMAGDIGETPVDPIKEMLARFDKSPWTVFPTIVTTHKLEKDLKLYMEQFAPMADIEREMYVHGLVPTHLERAPNEVLDVKYYCRKNDYHRTIDLGEIYPPSLTLDVPKIKYPVKENASYVHLLIDPDHINTRFEPVVDSSEEDLWPTTPDDDIPKQYLHYLKVNVPHHNNSEGDVMVQYMPPHPPNTTGLHRYTWLVYEQPHRYINFTEKRILSTTAYERDWFRLHNFVKKYNFSDPISGTFFYAKFDEAVPYIYAALDDVFI